VHFGIHLGLRFCARWPGCHGSNDSGLKLIVNDSAIPAYLTVQPDGVLLAVKVQPRASRNEIAGPLGNELRIKVTAPPVDAAANEALLRLVAERLDCPRNSVRLIRGHASRHKTLKLLGLDVNSIAARLR